MGRVKVLGGGSASSSSSCSAGCGLTQDHAGGGHHSRRLIQTASPPAARPVANAPGQHHALSASSHYHGQPSAPASSAHGQRHAPSAASRSLSFAVGLTPGGCADSDEESEPDSSHVGALSAAIRSQLASSAILQAPPGRVPKPVQPQGTAHEAGPEGGGGHQPPLWVTAERLACNASQGGVVTRQLHAPGVHGERAAKVLAPGLRCAECPRCKALQLP